MSALNDVKTVVLDLDGTLYDKRGLAARLTACLWWCLPVLAAERLSRRNMHYLQFTSEEEFYSHFFAMMSLGHLWTAGMAAWWHRRIYMPLMVQLIGKTCKKRQEALDIIEACKARGLKMAIYSDYGCVEEKLRVLNIDSKQFELLISAPELGSLKPSEDCARQVLEMLGADPQTTLFVGDRWDTDGASAMAVGAKFYLIK